MVIYLQDSKSYAVGLTADSFGSNNPIRVDGGMGRIKACCDKPLLLLETVEKVVGDPGIEPGVRLREGVTVPCHTLRPVAHCSCALR